MYLSTDIRTGCRADGFEMNWVDAFVTMVKMKGCKSFERGKINKSLRQETTSMPSSGGSHDRRKAISVEAVSNS
ncbi:hypothetical protein QL285_006668 [Trifolium repens]|nr:hypothetical protein QL285_066486 [Trifolium repens]KAK2378689.1 hypothetical protein QL285_066571 [Trifolium repens]KAK2447297.1 hypothetical protein QL285_006668 [Trifolium repens]